MHTCYSPVRQSPARSASTPPDALRLACVKPAASVHPEPGSNSPLLVIYCYISSLDCCRFRIPSIVFSVLTGLTLFVCPCTLKTTFAACLGSKMSMFLSLPGSSAPLVSDVLFPVCGCKISANFSPVQILFELFSRFSAFIRLSYCKSVRLKCVYKC